MTTYATPPWAAPSPADAPIELRDHPTTPVVAGTTARARWELPAFVVLLAGTAVLYLWGLSASGWANSFYSAAAQAGSQSWKAFLFGSSDAANSITVDKPPMALWPMALSMRIFGLSSWSILVPQALMGVGDRRHRRRHGAPAGRCRRRAARRRRARADAGGRADVPLQQPRRPARAADDGGRGHAAARPSTTAGPRWMVATGVLIGFAFLTKQLQALLVVPGFARRLPGRRARAGGGGASARAARRRRR